MSNMGDRIRLARKRVHMKADDLGKLIGKNRATIYRYESGEITEIPYFTIVALAKALQTTPAYLNGTTDDPRSYDDREEEYIDTPMSKEEARREYYRLRQDDPKIYQLINDLADMTIAHQEFIFKAAAEFAEMDRQKLNIDSTEYPE